MSVLDPEILEDNGDSGNKLRTSYSDVSSTDRPTFTGRTTHSRYTAVWLCKIHVVKSLGPLLAFWKMQHLLLMKLEMYVLLIISAVVKK